MLVRALQIGLTPLFAYLGVRGIDWSRLSLSFREIQPAFLCIGLVMATISMGLRALRWRALLQTQRPIPYNSVFWATSGGYLANTFLPARAGELLRSVMLSRTYGISNAFLLATTATERVLDAAALAIASAVALTAVGHAPLWMAGAVRLIGLASAGGVLVILLLPSSQHKLTRFFDLLPQRFRSRCVVMTGEIASGVGALRFPRAATQFALLTPVIWGLDTFGAIIVANSLHVPLAFPAAFLLLAAIGLSSAVPVTPGNVGFSQFVAITVLVPLGVLRDQALLYILLLQAIGAVNVAIWGLLAIWRFRNANREASRALHSPAAVPPTLALHAKILEN